MATPQRENLRRQRGENTFSPRCLSFCNFGKIAKTPLLNVRGPGQLLLPCGQFTFAGPLPPAHTPRDSIAAVFRIVFSYSLSYPTYFTSRENFLQPFRLRQTFPPARATIALQLHQQRVPFSLSHISSHPGGRLRGFFASAPAAVGRNRKGRAAVFSLDPARPMGYDGEKGGVLWTKP